MARYLSGILWVQIVVTPLAFSASDIQWTFDTPDSFDYLLTSGSSPELYSGSLPANDPAINLIVGKRYGVTVTDPVTHPFQVIAKATDSSQDIELLSQGSTESSFESDPDVNWVDSGSGLVEFTVTDALVTAMRQGDRTPGYRCEVHPATMRGDFAVYGAGQEITNPIPESIAKGTIIVELETLIDGLAAPLGVADPDDGSGRLFIYDQAGQVYVVSEGSRSVFLDVASRLVSLGVSGPGSYDERGLLGFAVHPNFSSNPKVYTYTSEPVSASADFTAPLSGAANHQSVAAEWTVSSTDSNLIDPSTRREILRIDQPQFNHNGGTLHFGPDGYLYIALGDGGAADDQGDGHGPGGNGQDRNTVLGSIIRIDVAGNNSANGRYGIPLDNPFVGVDGIDEIFAYGFRNPFQFSFDSKTGDLYAGDVGQNDIEEIDRVTAGGNYGWRHKEGSFYFDPNGSSGGFVTTEPVAPLPAGLIDPIAEYDHNEGLSVIGGFVYNRPEIPSLTRRYVFGDFGTGFATPAGRLFFLDLAANEIRELRIGATDRPLGLWVKGFGSDAEGNIYVCGSRTLGPSGTTGTVLKLIPPPTSEVPVPIWQLY